MRKRNDALLAIVFCLILLMYTGAGYNKTGNIKLLFGEIVCLFLLASTTITYFKTARAEKKRKVKKKKNKSIIKISKRFRKNSLRINKKYKTQEEIPDLKTAYIQSAWDELNKI